MRNCGNCLYKDRLKTEEPCLECMYSLNWEPEEDQEEEDNDNQ